MRAVGGEKVFDKILCKVFHKSEITINDIVSALFTCSMAVFMCVAAGGLINSIMYDLYGYALLPIDALPTASASIFLKHFVLGATIAGTIVLSIVGSVRASETVGKIKVAKCPLKKEKQ